MSSPVQLQSLLLGVYTENDGSYTHTPAFQQFNTKTGGKLMESLNKFPTPLKKGKARLFHGIVEGFVSVAVVGLGSKDAGHSEIEEMDLKRENIRTAVATGVHQLRDVIGEHTVYVDACGDAEAAAEGSTLALFQYDQLKSVEFRKPTVTVELIKGSDLASQAAWKIGMIKATSQNIARELMETPSNILTPTAFAEQAAALMSGLQVKVIPRDQAWAEEQKMGSFLSVTKGSSQPPVFLELHYAGGKPGSQPFVIVGKGITFDTGGISLKSPAGMERMRADMGGAAVTTVTIRAIAQLKLPINVIGLIPLCENMPGGRASRPGDVVTARNGKTIQIDNTDAEGRLILADGLCYAADFKPFAVMDIATLTGAMAIALGGGATGVFTNAASLWPILHQCGGVTGDRVWRMPLFDFYRKRMDAHLADINNANSSRDGGSCNAAAFLKEFVPVPNWLHLDIAGVLDHTNDVPYMDEGMTGRPTRTLIEFFKHLSRQ